MSSRWRPRSVGFGSAYVVAVCLAALLLIGCGEQPPHLNVQVTSPVGRPGTCAFCKKKIDPVSEKHLVTFRGIQYTVCDGKCAADLEGWLAKQ